MIVAVTDETIAAAGYIHSVSWKASHKSFCSAEFVEQHTPEAQTAYLRRELAAGKQLFLLVDAQQPVGIVSVDDDLIENLYVLPDQQRKGYGSQLLSFAISQCKGAARLWLLSNNEEAYCFYVKNGFLETGNRKKLKSWLSEIELIRKSKQNEVDNT